MSDITVDVDDRKRLLQRALDYYNGNPVLPLRNRVGETGDNLPINFGRLIVDKGASFLFGAELPTQVTDKNMEPQQDWLNECWRRNKRGILLQKLGTNGGIFGHVFIRLLPSRDDTNFPRIINLDPRIVEVTTDPDDIDIVWSFTITPPPQKVNGEEIKRRTCITTPSGQAGYRVDQDGWFIVDQHQQGGEWVDYQSVQWPYDFPPVLQCQNLPKPNDFWGESDLPPDILHILDGINRVASHQNKIIRLHAHPKLWTNGMGKANLNTAIDAVIHLPSETASLNALKVDANLDHNLNFLRELMEDLAMLTRIPLVAMGKSDNLGALSGVALKVRYQPLIDKTESKRLTYGDMLIECDRCLLAMADMGDTTITTQVWPNLVPNDDLAARQIAVLDDSLGVASIETLSEQFGYSYEEEQRRIAEEKAKAAGQNTALMPPADPNAPPVNGQVPPPQPLQGPIPDIARSGHSK